MKFTVDYKVGVIPQCRPPRGGRGLKYKLCHALREARQVAPLAGGVD